MCIIGPDKICVIYSYCLLFVTLLCFDLYFCFPFSFCYFYSYSVSLLVYVLLVYLPFYLPIIFSFLSKLFCSSIYLIPRNDFDLNAVTSHQLPVEYREYLSL